MNSFLATVTRDHFQTYCDKRSPSKIQPGYFEVPTQATTSNRDPENKRRDLIVLAALIEHLECLARFFLKLAVQRT